MSSNIPGHDNAQYLSWMVWWQLGDRSMKDLHGHVSSLDCVVHSNRYTVTVFGT